MLQLCPANLLESSTNTLRLSGSNCTGLGGWWGEIVFMLATASASYILTVIDLSC